MGAKFIEIAYFIPYYWLPRRCHHGITDLFVNNPKNNKLPFRFECVMEGIKERSIADCTQKVFANVAYVPTDRKDEEFDPKRVDKYYKCACKSTKARMDCPSDAHWGAVGTSS